MKPTALLMTVLLTLSILPMTSHADGDPSEKHKKVATAPAPAAKPPVETTTAPIETAAPAEAASSTPAEPTAATTAVTPEAAVEAPAAAAAIPAASPAAPGCAYGHLIGKKDTEIDRAQFGDKIVRSLKPGQIVTMEYLENRINLNVDDSGVILSVTCG